MTSTSDDPNSGRGPAEADAPGASDAAVFADLEKNFGGALKTVLALYLETSNALSERLQDAMACAYWQEAVRVAIQIGDKADALGFHPVAQAAHAFAYAAYHDADDDDRPHRLRSDAQMVVLEYERFRLALEMRFRDHIAPGLRSVA